jgi:hypothetical protein
MAMKPAVLRQLHARDPWCMHCGSDVDLVPHHRKNRGAGGSKSRENDVTNVMLICALYNGLMESDADVAQQARDWGHKLRSWQDTFNPVFDFPSGRWYRLTPDGGRTETTRDAVPF